MPAHELSAFDAASILIVLAAALGYLNQRFFKLPPSVGLTVMGAVASLLVVAIDKLTDATGISVALALSLPESTMRTIILATTYMVVMFSVIVQGGSVGRLISKLAGSAKDQRAHGH